MSPTPPLPPAPERRQVLIEDMLSRAQQGHHCAACSGVCCTFVANSMKITPVETQDLRRYLEAERRWTPELMDQLAHTIERFRLDKEIGDGRRSLRKTYTCPFYRPGPKGCSISRKHKPYGCLAFNAREPGITQGGNCASAQDLLDARGQQHAGEAEENERLQQEWGWFDKTLPIPMALLQSQPPVSG